MIGTTRLPCGHQRANIPAEPGMYQRRCQTCRATFTATVAPARNASLAGIGVLRIDWEPA